MNFLDPYEDITTENVIYITQNIPTNDTEDNFNETFTEGCKCENVCTIESNCSCLIKYGIKGINYKNNGNLNIKDMLYTSYVLNTDKINNGIFECNGNCRCKHKICGNRLVQFGPRNNLEIRNCPEKGLGLFTNKYIFKGNLICEYAGEVITKSEAATRFKHNKENKLMNYIICLQEHFGDKLNSTFIDPSYFGNIGRYLNHSCNPNCELVPVRIDCIVPKLCIFAKRDIEENCELTFDYGDGKNNIVENSEMELKKCLCNASDCKKWMPYNTNIGK